MKKTKRLLLASAVALTSSTGLAGLAAADEINFILCGDAVDAKHQEYIDEWNAANPDDKVAVEVVGWGQCQDKVTTLAVAGTPVDIAYVGSRTLKQFALNDLIVPVPMSEEDRSSYYPFVPETVTFDDTQWGIPLAFTTKALIWNKDLFEAAGLDPETPPKTWAEQQQFAQTISEKTDADGFGLVAKTFDGTVHWFLHWVYTNGGSVIDADGNITLNSPENLAALTALKDIVPFSEEGPTAYEQNEVRAMFLDGTIGMMHIGAGVVPLITKTDINWGLATLPVRPEAKGPGTLLITDSLAVFKGTDTEQTAIEFGKFFTARDRQFAYETQFGLTPLRPLPQVDELVAANDYWKVFIDSIEFGGPEPLFTDYVGFQNTIIEMVQSVVTGQAEPAAALETAAAELEQYK